MKQVASNILIQLKDKKQFSCEKAWVMLDYNKRGEICIEDLRNGLSEIEINFTKQDLANLFNFIDRDEDGIISFVEFKDYWNQNRNIFEK